MSLVKQNQRTVREYRAAGQRWPATSKEIAAWAIQNEKWDMPHEAVLKRCAEEIAAAMGVAYFPDRGGRRVRLLHPATIRRHGVLSAAWHDRGGVRRAF